MKSRSNNLIVAIYDTHSEDIINQTNDEYLKLFQHYQDIVSNVQDEDLRRRIIYSQLNIEEFLFAQINKSSRLFYEFGFNDFRKLMLDNKFNLDSKQKK